MNKIKILIADDHPMMREALTTAMEGETDLVVIGEASNGVEAIKLAAKLKPDVVLMDMLMPEMNGLNAITKLQETQPDIKIMVVSSLEDEDRILAAVQAGALGYFPKSAPRSYLLEGIRKVADGVPYLPSGIAAKLFKGLRDMRSQPAGRSAVDEPLTSRQGELLLLVGEGRSDKEISEILHLSEATVRAHLHQMRQRLGLDSRAQLIAYANRSQKAK